MAFKKPDKDREVFKFICIVCGKVYESSVDETKIWPDTPPRCTEHLISRGVWVDYY